MCYYLICNHLVVIFLLIFVQLTSGFVPQAQTCNPQVDVEFAEDPTGTTSFLKCRNYGPPEYGYWERHYCPNDMSFEFSSQQCKAASMPPNAVRQENEILHIAILNGTCANGEQCIGGTVCDLAKRRCLCPYGSVANLETLSCVQPQNMANGNPLIQPQQPNAPASSSVSATAQQQIQQQYANYYGQAPNRYSSQPSVSPSASSSPMGTTSLNQFYRSVLDQLQQARTAVLQQSQNPSAKIVANIQQQTVTTGALPGSSCAHGERCEGGSICMHPMNVCLCPGELESQNGQCVPSYQKAISGIAKVGIGARCNQYNTFCDFESNCVNGYCKCLLPLVEQAGKCVRPAVRKESGPGEACHNGELCVRGSVCDQQVPVCVCPAGTLLENGWCIQPTRPPPPSPPAPATTNLVNEHTANGNYHNQHSGESGSAYVTGGGYIPPPSSPPASLETFSKQNPIKKPTGHVSNAHKQQSAVGDRCSLNTECMLGAYCNGNSQPPTCQCLSTHVNLNDRCEKVIFPGQKGCDNDLQCTTAYAGTRCINRQCVCPPGSKAIEQTCVSAHAWPGEQCNQSNAIPACSGQSYCSDQQICECPAPLIIHQKQCVARPQVPMSTSSHQTMPCTQDSECPTNFCAWTTGVSALRRGCATILSVSQYCLWILPLRISTKRRG